MNLAFLILLTALGSPAHPPGAPDLEPPRRDYYAYVCAESEDEVSLVRFGPGGLEVVKSIEVGTFPAEIEGPHGIGISPSGRYWYVSIAHGQPFGTIHKFTTGSDEWQESATVGMFPATLAVAATTGLLYVVNSDFYGDHVPSTISVVETRTMTEVEQIPTGVMPHGARLSRDGKKLYSVNMMDDELVEVDALRFEIGRRLALGMAGSSSAQPPHATAHAGHSDDGADHSDAGDHGGAAEPDDHGPTIEPSWVTDPVGASERSQGKVYVAALSSHEVIEVDLDAWKVTRRFETADGPYNLAVSKDGELLVVTYKKSDAVGFWNLTTGEEIARLATSRRIPHGVVITPDGRFSFVTVEGVGGEPGVVEVYDNRIPARVGTINVGKQAGGIALWERGA